MKTMPNSTAEEKLRWIRPILDKKISISNLAEVCPFSERAIKYWLSNYRQYGLPGLENRSTTPKTQPGETPIRVKERLIELRHETSLSAKKLCWKLLKEGIDINDRTAGRVLKREGLTRKYRSRKKSYRRSSVRLLPGELIEIDLKYVPDKVEGKRCYQYTAIDCASRWRLLEIYDQEASYTAIAFLDKLIKIFPYRIKAIKTDNAAIFTNRYNGYLKSRDPLNPRLHPLDLHCQSLGIEHYLIDPGKPQQNGKVERSHRTDQEHFYDKIEYNTIEELKYQSKLWNMYYNDLEHYSLNGATPNEALKKVQNVVS
jgi:transposase InsO family protein